MGRPTAPGEAAPAVTLRQLLPPLAGAVEVRSLEQPLIAARRSDTATAGRPHVVLNMVSSADGRATVAGRSGALSDAADRELFHRLRSLTDAVMVGSGTLRAEHYGRIVPDPAARRARVQAGLSEEPYACVVSARVSLPPDIPLLAELEARIVILTGSDESLPATTAAQVEYIRAPQSDGQLDLAEALAELHRRFAVNALLCEGGPTLNAALLAAGLVDELFLSLAPTLVGGLQPLTIISGGELSPPLDLELVSLLEHESHLFLHYRVGADRAPA